MPACSPPFGLGEGIGQLRAQGVEPGPVMGRDRQWLEAVRAQRGLRRGPAGASLLQVVLGDHQAHRPLDQRRIVEPELGQDGVPFGDRVLRGPIHDPEQDPTALDVAQEGVAQSLPLVGALDEPGDVGHDHGARILRRRRRAPGRRGWALWW